MQRLAIGMMLCLAASAVWAQSGAVYQWKDANGVTQYSSTPPPKGAYQTRTVSNHGASLAGTATAEAKPSESPQCTAARGNITLLQNKSATVQMDSDGDGKPDKTLSDDDRVKQLAVAEASVKANCTAAAAPDKP